ncbi:MAG: transcriptional regulator [Clostridiaceae bacterium]|nr:transcriptional regulator [Clostridiaceae bacterium]
MTFADKLNFLMTITETSNSVLAGRVSLDASYISRLRRGKRLMPRDAGIIQSMAASLARRCSGDYQKKVLSDVLGLASLPDDSAAFAGRIADWLLHGNPGGVEPVEQFLSCFSNLGSHPVSARPQMKYQPPSLHEAVSIFYGIEGKRQAAEYFLSEVAACEKPQTLLLFSGEETSWMTADPEFSHKWAELMIRILSKGNKIKIIHTISRDLDEMLSAIGQWMPLYMSGNIEPYFYPKKRDGVFKRTLFIAPETAAVVSNSIGDQISIAANVLYRDHEAVTSFAEEFLQYLRLCRPLMRIFTARDRDAYFSTLAEFERERADTLLKTESLSVLTMPETLLASIAGRSGSGSSNNPSIHAERYGRFRENLKTNHFTELIHLPDIDMVKKGGVKVSMSDMLGGGAVHYTPKEFVAHLKNIVDLLCSCENYHVRLIDRPGDDRYMVYAREELGVIVAKTSQPPIVLAMNEGNMTAAFWDFLKSMAKEKKYEDPGNEAAIASLRLYLKKLDVQI